MSMAISKPATHEVGFEFESALASIVERIRGQRKRGLRIAQVLAGLEGMSLEGVEGVAEPSLMTRVERDPLDEVAVAGVDGGLLEQQLHGVDLILVRALAVVFHYSDGKLGHVEYLPSGTPPSRLVDVAEPLDARDFMILTGMERQLAELEVAAEAVRGEGVELLLLDGSVVPQYVNRFPHHPLLLERYQRLIQNYTGLYRACAESGVLLAGVVKDSRGARFVELLRRRVLPALGNIGLEREELAVLERSRDTALLDYLIGVGERTMFFTYAERPGSYVLGDLGTWGEGVYVFYIKTVPFDQPLRVEFVDCLGEPAETARRVASLVYTLSSHHDAFGLPSVLIEADTCARLSEEDLWAVRDSITDRLGPVGLQELRRNRRPFWGG
jgi:hypothetical protein